MREKINISMECYKKTILNDLQRVAFSNINLKIHSHAANFIQFSNKRYNSTLALSRCIKTIIEECVEKFHVVTNSDCYTINVWS